MITKEKTQHVQAFIINIGRQHQLDGHVCPRDILYYFSVVLFQVFFTKKDHVNYMAQLPLGDDHDQTSKQ
ncbi:MAG: hypothetical protein IPP37_07850 [Saprospiraceae bacterium]|nr:hypothetical protein [Saprospiraceae bacterium]